MTTNNSAHINSTNKQPAKKVTPYLAIFDLDETLIAADSASLWSAYLVEKGVAPSSLLQEEKEMMEAYAKGQMDMDDYMQATLKPMIGMDDTAIAGLVDEFIVQRIKPALYQDAIERIEWHKRRGDTILVISATGEHLVKPIAQLLGADDAIAINLEQVDGKFHRQDNRYTQLPIWKGDQDESLARPTRYRVQRQLRIQRLYQRPSTIGRSRSPICRQPGPCTGASRPDE